MSVVRESTVVIPYDGRELSLLAELTIHSYVGDVTYGITQFEVEQTPYTLRITFPYTEGADGLEYCGIYHRILDYAQTYDELVPFNNPVIEPNIEFTHE